MTSETEALKSQNEKQEIFHRWKVFDAMQDGFMKTDIGILLFDKVRFSNSSTNNAASLPLNRYYEHYSRKQRETIATIVAQIRCKIPSPRPVAFGCTFLTARVDNCEELREYVIFRFTTVTTSRESNSGDVNLSQVFFIEPSGRVYRNWRDFVDANKLPRCTYWAPNDGVYKPEGPIWKYSSPEANKSFIKRHVDKVMTVAGIGVIGAGIFAIAPVTAAVTGAGLCVYGTGSSIATLRDRHKHSQSIKPDNVEAISSHLTLLTVGLTGLSSAAFACRQQIINRFGKLAPAMLRTMNIGVLCLDATGLAFMSYVYYEKWSAGEITFEDTLNLVLRVYLLHGQVSNTIEVHRMLSSNNTAAPLRLTKTQKRNLRKRRAKAAKRGVQLSPSTSTVKVTDTNCNSFDSMKLIARFMGCNAVTFLRRHFPREEVIIQFLIDVKQLISGLWKGDIGREDFFLNLVVHVRNLAQILANDCDSLRRYAAMLGFQLDVNSVGAAYNGFQQVNDSEDSLSEELDQMIQQIPGEELEPSAPDGDLLDSKSSEPVAEDIMKRINVEVILNAVEMLISKCIVHQNSAMLLVFAEAVKYIRNQLVTQLVQKYERAFSVTMATLNDAEKATEALTVLGVKVGEQFYPVCSVLAETLSEAVEKPEQFVEAAEYAIGVRGKEDLVDDKIDKVAGRISKSVAALFGLASAKTDIGLQQTLDMLEHITNFYVTEKVTEFDQLRTDSDKLFQDNASILGDKMAHQMLAKIGMSADPVETALNCANLELDNVQVGRLREYCSSMTPPDAEDKATSSSDSVESRLLEYCSSMTPPDAEDKATSSSDSVESRLLEYCSSMTPPDAEDKATSSSDSADSSNSEDDFLITLTMRTCSAFMNNIRRIDCAGDDPQKQLQKVLLFVLHQFARATSNSVGQLRQLKSNLDVLGPAKYKLFLKKLKACPQKNKSTLQKTSERLMAFGDDIAFEYELFNVDDQLGGVNLWQSSADEEGLQVKSTENCCMELSASEFKNLASNLFSIKIGSNFSVEKSQNSVYLKSDDYIVTFSLDEESGSWLVILADQRVNQDD